MGKWEKLYLKRPTESNSASQLLPLEPTSASRGEASHYKAPSSINISLCSCDGVLITFLNGVTCKSSVADILEKVRYTKAIKYLAQILKRAFEHSNGEIEKNNVEYSF